MSIVDATRQAVRGLVRTDAKFLRDAHRSGSEGWIRDAERNRLRAADRVGQFFAGVRP